MIINFLPSVGGD